MAPPRPTRQPALAAVASHNRRLFAGALLGRSASWVTTDLLLAWHVHLHRGLGGPATGSFLCVLLIVGGFSTLLTGRLLDLRPVGTRMMVRVQLLGACVMAPCFVWQFNAQTASGLTAAAVAYRLGYSVVDVAQNGLSTLLPASDAEARRYAGWRIAASSIARLCVLVTFWLLDGRTSGWTTIWIWVVAAAGLASSASLIGVARVIPDARPRAVSEPRMLPDTAGPSWAGLLAAAALSSLALPLQSRLLIFSDSRAWPHAGSWLIAALCIGAIAGPLAWSRSEALTGRAGALAGTTALIAASAFANAAVPAGAVLRTAAAAVQGLSVASLSACMWIAAARIARAERGPHGRRDPAIFSMVIAVVHFAAAAGALLTGLLIQGMASDDTHARLLTAGLTTLAAIGMAALLAGVRSEVATATHRNRAP